MTRSMQATERHLKDAAIDIAQVVAHIREAKRTDPDPEIADQVYGPILNNLKVTAVAITARVIAGSPDLEREAKK